MRMQTAGGPSPSPSVRTSVRRMYYVDGPLSDIYDLELVHELEHEIWPFGTKHGD